MKSPREAMVVPDMVPLNSAVLCEDCKQISASKGNCAGCGSKALLNLAAVLNPPAKPILVTSTRQAARRALEIHYRAAHRMEA